MVTLVRPYRRDRPGRGGPQPDAAVIAIAPCTRVLPARRRDGFSRSRPRHHLGAAITTSGRWRPDQHHAPACDPIAPPIRTALAWGAQPRCERSVVQVEGSPREDASHTTPLTVAADSECRIVDCRLAAFLGAALRSCSSRPDVGYWCIGLGLAAVFTTVFVHALFYSRLLRGSDHMGSARRRGRCAFAQHAAAGARPHAALAAHLRAPVLRRSRQRHRERRGSRLAGRSRRLPCGNRSCLLPRRSLCSSCTVAGLAPVFIKTSAKVARGTRSTQSLTGISVFEARRQGTDRGQGRHPGSATCRTIFPCWLNFGGDPQRSPRAKRSTSRTATGTTSFWARGHGARTLSTRRATATACCT